MARLVPYNEVANSPWNIWKNENGKYESDQVDHVLLIDIRPTLQSLLAIFQCQNAQDIPTLLRQIQVNTERRRPAKRGKGR